jgi:2-iminoacetate synthase ThiH
LFSLNVPSAISAGKWDRKKPILPEDEYTEKIDELIALGGDQLLLQGGMNPALGIGFYARLFCRLKELYPDLKLHALGPPEIAFLSKKEKLSYNKVLTRLMEAGLDSLPGAGAEILSDGSAGLSPRRLQSANGLGLCGKPINLICRLLQQ